MKATRTQKKKGLCGHICRAELFDLLLRLIHQAYPKKIVSGFDLFVQKYIEPTFWNSTISSDRSKLRLSKKLNNFLLDNEQSLSKIFKEHESGREGFTLEQAQKFAQTGENGNPILDVKQVKQAFVFSQMSLKNEQKQSKKY